MTAAEIAAVIQEKEGRLCARFYRRADGTMLTADCPLGTGRFWRQVKTRLFAGAALIAVAAGTAVATGSHQSQPPPLRTDKLSLLWDNTKTQVKAWFGVKPKNQFIMGDICVLPPKQMTTGSAGEQP